MDKIYKNAIEIGMNFSIDIQIEGDITDYEAPSIDGPGGYSFTEFKITFIPMYLPEPVNDADNRIDLGHEFTEKQLYYWLEDNFDQLHKNVHICINKSVHKCVEDFEDYLIEVYNHG